MTTEFSRLILPARPEYVAFARITGASLANRHGLSYDELEDFRLAVDEIFFALVPATGPGCADDGPEAARSESRIEIRFSTTTTGIEVEAARLGSDGNEVILSELCSRILSAVVDAYELRPSTTHTGPSTCIWMRRAGPNKAAEQ